MRYSAITIIYNPASTGPGKTYALALRRILGQRFPAHKLAIKAIATKHAGHAEELAYRAAADPDSPTPLIIASGGDGSYHEVVNGAMRAQAEGAKPVCGLLPGGNANDHYRALHTAAIEDQIDSGKTRAIDVLRITIQHINGPQVRYAHSYCGFGLTAEIGRELNRWKLNPFREIIIVIRGLWRLRAKKVLINSREHIYSSLVCSNIPRMSKILKVSDQPRLRDGHFELVRVHGSRKSALLRALLQASVMGLRQTKRVSSFTFTTIKPLRLQIDGEIYKLPASTQVEVTCLRKRLRCVI